MKRIRPLLIAAGVAVLLIAGWMMLGGRMLSVYYTGALERARAEGRYEAAANAAERLIGQEPDNRGLRMMGAEVLAEGGLFSRAEYHLREALALGGPQQAETFAALSALYVRQDKLMDAVALLDNARGLSAGSAEAMRPDAPSPSPEPGVYDRPVTLTFAVPDGCVWYYSLTEEYPSVESPYTGPVELPPGETFVRVVAVDENGVASALWSGTYTLDNLNFPVTFREPVIEAALRAHIGRPEGDIYSRDLAGVTALVVEAENDYHTLEDLLLLPDLQTLSLKGRGSPCDISALSGLPGLQRMRLEAMGLDSVDLAALEKLAHLETLKLPGNNLTSLTPLSGLTALTALDIGANSVIDASPLSGLTALTELDLSHNSVQDLAPLMPLTALVRADLSDNRIASMDGFGNMQALTELNVSGNQLNDLQALEGLTQMTVLDASRNMIEDIAPLRLMTALTDLRLTGNRIGEVTALQSMKSLKTLELSSNYIQSVGMLQHCAALEILWLDKNELSSVEPLRGLAKLREVHVGSNKLTDLKPLLDCPALKEVYAFGNKVTADAAFTQKGITVYV